MFYNQRKKLNIYFRATALALALSIGISLPLSSGLMVAEASGALSYPSLSGIESIKYQMGISGEAFDILEIVPKEGSGSMGYYIDGQEPFADWQSTLSSLHSPDGGEALRAGAVNAKIDELRAADILRDDGSAPLGISGSYTEYMEWEENIPEDTVRITLQDSETTTVNGSFERAGVGEYGYFDEIVTTKIVNAVDATHYQIIERLVQGEAPDNINPETLFYYTPTFSVITIEELEETPEIVEGKAIYFLQEDGEYTFQGIVGEDSYIVDATPNPDAPANTFFYMVEDYGVPSKDYTAGDYYAIHGGFTNVINDEIGKNHTDKHFEIEHHGYEYSEEGDGEFILVEGGSETVSIQYESVYAYVPIVNNQWFHRYVFDDHNAVLEPSFKIEVNSKIASNITAEDINTADLIVFTVGYDLSKTSADKATPELYTASNDISAEVLTLLKAAVDNNSKPIIIDAKMLYKVTAATSLKSFSDYILGKKFTLPVYPYQYSTGYVKDGVYVFNRQTGATTLDQTHNNMITSDLLVEMKPALYQEEGGAYVEVWSQIKSDNNLRTLTNSSELLPELVTMANSIRHIINFADRLEVNNKNQINVLEIQPLRYNQDKTIDDEELTADKILEILPENSIAKENIHIETMSISEFIGKIEDISEVYDMVYIGASLEGFNTTMIYSTEVPNYNDDNMDGLIYTNVGDYMYVFNQVLGALNSDYDTTAPKVRKTSSLWPTINEWTPIRDDSSTSHKARGAGLDLTPVKYQELVNFVNSGFPIIVSDKLLSSQNAEGEKEIEVAIRFAQDTDANEISSVYDSVQLEVYGFDYYADIYPNDINYTWYKDDAPIAGANETEYIATEGGVYHCVVSISNGGITLDTGKSNSIEITHYDTQPSRIAETGSAVNSYATPLELFHVDNDDITSNDITSATPTGTVFTVDALLNTELVPFSEAEIANIEYSWYVDFSNRTWAKLNGISSGNYNMTTYLGTDADLINDGRTITAKLQAQNFVIRGYVARAEVTLASGDVHVYYSERVGINPDDRESNSGPFVASLPLVSSTNTPNSPSEVAGAKTHRYDNLAPTVYAQNKANAINPTAGGDEIELYINTPQMGYLPSASDMLIDSSEIAYSYQWYKDDAPIAGATDLRHTISDNYEGDYHLEVTADIAGISLTSKTKISEINNRMRFRGEKLTTTGEADENIITVPPQTPKLINEFYVDNTSVIYSFLASTKDNHNVMSMGDAKANSGVVLSYLNLSKPTIIFSEYADGSQKKPTDFAGIDNFEDTNEDGRVNEDDDLSLINNSTLYFEFKIENDTDPTPATTKYNAHLYVDLDADGRYEADEMISSISIKHVGTNTTVTNGNMVAGETYSVSRHLPDTYQGPVTWKLEILEVGNDTLSDSAEGITFIQPEKAIEIDVLQVLGKKTTNGKPLMEIQSYADKIARLETMGLYDINVTTEHIGDLNDMSEEEVKAKFDEYDMLLLGFEESFGRYDDFGFNTDTTKATIEFVESGKALLLTHDVLSTISAPYDKYPIVSDGVGDATKNLSVDRIGYYTGYVFNMMLRSYVNMDRFGITHPQYGINDYSPYRMENLGVASGNNYVANGYAGMTSAIENNLINEDYSIAYKHGSAEYDANGNRISVEYLDETRGFSNLAITRFAFEYKNTVSNMFFTDSLYRNAMLPSETTRVSQINKGQITTYPYNVNLEEFGGEIDRDKGSFTDPNGGVDNLLTVSTTHEQAYQLNLNSEEIVVWYALADDGLAGATGYENHYNDAMNNYYLFNNGNITYSGAGHSGSNVSEPEAELFINTMVAAYRNSNVNPTVEFIDESSREITDFFVPAEFDENGEYGGSIANGSNSAFDKAITFIFADENITASKTVSLALFIDEKEVGDIEYFTYSNIDDDGNMMLPLYINLDGVNEYIEVPIYDENGDRVQDELLDDNLYAIDIPNEVFSLLDENTDEVTLRIEVSTRITGSTEILGGYTDMSIKKLGLLPLG